MLKSVHLRKNEWETFVLSHGYCLKILIGMWRHIRTMMSWVHWTIYLKQTSLITALFICQQFIRFPLELCKAISSPESNKLGGNAICKYTAVIVIVKNYSCALETIPTQMACTRYIFQADLQSSSGLAFWITGHWRWGNKLCFTLSWLQSVAEILNLHLNCQPIAIFPISKKMSPGHHVGQQETLLGLSDRSIKPK